MSPRIKGPTPILEIDGTDVGERVYMFGLIQRSGRDGDELQVSIWEHDPVPIGYGAPMTVRTSWDGGKNLWRCDVATLVDASVDQRMQHFRLEGQFVREGLK